MYYIYEYFEVNTGNIFYVGSGSKNRLFDNHSRSKEFQRIAALRNVAVRVYMKDLSREEVIRIETSRIAELKELGEPLVNKALKGTIPKPSISANLKKSYSGQKKEFKDEHRRHLQESAISRDPKINASISQTMKGRSWRNEQWLITLFDDSEITFDKAQDVADYFGCSKSLVNNWKYGVMSSRWKRHIKKVEIKKKEK